MSLIGKIGSIVTIIGSLFMIIIGIVWYWVAGAFDSIFVFKTNIIWIISFTMLGFGITNFVLCSIAFKGNSTIRIVAGLISLISALIAWLPLFFPSLMVLIGGILLLLSKNNRK